LESNIVKHAGEVCVTVGQKVLLNDFCRKKCKDGKLAMRYIGPYKINSVTKKGVYQKKLVKQLALT